MELIVGLACWYLHSTTSIDQHIDPWTRLYFAAQDDGTWDCHRTPQWYLVTVGDCTVLAQRRDITRSHYVAELSPALAKALKLDFGFNSQGVPYGEWQVTIRRWYSTGGGRYLVV